ncbi:hypothetical protein HP439_04200 [Sphingobacterium shayense]|uniref:HmuY family protein n=1 Tax=Sphingobacterium shayense TaxID=626343 RepID=UPI001555A800|nr:HmuY family protein [Sphingobacterium shayense]NQD69924.1 hypothetical protein [Sphingobacterium shayense]
MKNLSKIKQLTFLAMILLSACSREESPTPVIPPSQGNNMTLEGGEGESDAANAVYIDLSADIQSSVKRDSWTLGFYSGDDFRVILNNQNAVAAMATSSTDLAAVNSSNVDISKLSYGYTPDKLANYDDSLARLDKTVFGQISADEDKNKVYILNTAHGTEVDLANIWKVKINRSTDGTYELQYALLSNNEIQTLQVTKEGDYNFNFISFANGKVKVEPKKTEWDLVWNKSMYYTTMGTGAIPYYYSDLVFINHLAGVSAAEVIFQNKEGASNGQPSYEEFDESNVSSVNFSASRNTIGSHWRVTTNGVGVLKDRFYVIKDQAGNVYKLKFLVMGVEDSGKRGYPEIEYQLVKNK